MRLNNKKWYFIITLFVVGFFSQNSIAQCNAKQYTDQLIRNTPSGYTFLKSYPLDGQEGRRVSIQYSYIFSKNATYTIRLAKHTEVKADIYDSNRTLVASSQYRGENYPGVAYKSRATGLYSIRFTFVNSRDYCSGATLSFKR